MVKPYMAKITTYGVVMAEDEAHAHQVADSYMREIFSDDGNPRIEIDGEVVKVEDLANGWDGECIPYGGDGNTRLGELLAPNETANGRAGSFIAGTSRLSAGFDARLNGGNMAQFYLQDSRGYVGNDVLWWAKDGNGYTTDLSKAGVDSQEAAQRMHDSRRSDVPWPKSYIDGKTRLAVDIQHIKRDEALAGKRIVLTPEPKSKKVADHIEQLGGLCEAENCTRMTTDIVYSRRRGEVLLCCDTCAQIVVDEECPEYHETCTNCGCLLPVN